MIKSIFSILIFSFAVFSCSQKNPTSEIDDPIQELEFEVYDSLLVDVMEDVTILDY